MINKSIQKNKGYTLLFAVLVSSLVLSIGISILTISRKEFLLSSSARDSTSAIYAADSGLECALYHNDNGDKFNYENPDLADLKCGGVTLDIDDLSDTNERTFTFHLKLLGNSCVTTKVKKYFVFDGLAPTYLKTSIESRGYNIGWNTGTETCDNPSPRRVERILYYDTFSEFLGPIVVTITKGGGGTGSIITSIAGLECDASCTTNTITLPRSLYYNQNHSFSPTPSGGSSFDSWGGDAAGVCNGQFGCLIQLNGSKTIIVNFSSP
ncbi:MAG TPA: hypothetical protein VJI66_02190 [Candidatus Paceibacterota bacterium]